jgi:hypothetical protein
MIDKDGSTCEVTLKRKRSGRYQRPFEHHGFVSAAHQTIFLLREIYNDLRLSQAAVKLRIRHVARKRHVRPIRDPDAGFLKVSRYPEQEFFGLQERRRLKNIRVRLIPIE